MSDVTEPSSEIRFRGSVWSIDDLPPPCICGKCENAPQLGDQYFVVLEKMDALCVYIPKLASVAWVGLQGGVDYSGASLTLPSDAVSSTT